MLLVRFTRVWFVEVGVRFLESEEPRFAGEWYGVLHFLGREEAIDLLKLTCAGGLFFRFSAEFPRHMFRLLHQQTHVLQPLAGISGSLHQAFIDFGEFLHKFNPFLI